MSQVAERYAQALFDVAQKNNNTQEISEALTALGSSIEMNEEIKKVLTSPLLTNQEKVDMIKKAMGSSVNKELVTFFDLLAKNNRLATIPEVVKAFKNAIARTSGVMTGEVQSAVALSDQEKTEIQKTIETKLARKVELQYNVNPKMIGGIEAKVGSYIFEDSIKSHMQKLNDFITRRVQ